jgi:hypothetical protein
VQSQTEVAAAALWFAALVLAPAAAASAASVWSARRRVGPELVAERAGAAARWAMLALIAAVAAVAVAFAPDVPLAPTLVVLALSACVVASRPSAGDSVYGERGVRRGWLARRFEELEEWRLAGEHLRWKLAGEWLACRVPTEMQAALRAKLAALCPERESPFNK